MSKKKRLQYVEAGACLTPDNNELRNCVLESTKCSNGDIFRSSRELKDQGIDAIGSSCLQQAEVKNIPIGRCTSDRDDGGCTSESRACIDEQYFEHDTNSMGCTVWLDEQTSQLSQYGECDVYRFQEDRNIYCLWSIDECASDGGTWYKANGPFGGLSGTCKCDKVETGACVYNNSTYHCAVSASGCDNASIYLPRNAFVELKLDFECRLCNSLDSFVTPTPTSPPVIPSAKPSTLPTYRLGTIPPQTIPSSEESDAASYPSSVPMRPISQPTNMESTAVGTQILSNSRSEGNNTNGWMIGGILLGIMVISGLVLSMWRNTRKQIVRSNVEAFEVNDDVSIASGSVI